MSFYCDNYLQVVKFFIHNICLPQKILNEAAASRDESLPYLSHAGHDAVWNSAPAVDCACGNKSELVLKSHFCHSSQRLYPRLSSNAKLKLRCATRRSPSVY
jgi:hypothetical protein